MSFYSTLQLISSFLSTGVKWGCNRENLPELKDNLAMGCVSISLIK
jgi:hypothetical protein